jgi:small subunit ribosomal protein S6
MFLLDSGRAGKDWDGARSEVEAILTKHGAEIVRSGRWDERKLAYEIKGHRRATYMLVYFNGTPETIDPVRRECALNDLVLRNMILLRRDDYPIPEDLGTTPVPAEAAPAADAEKAVESKEG